MWQVVQSVSGYDALEPVGLAPNPFRNPHSQLRLVADRFRGRDSLGRGDLILTQAD